MHQILNNVDRLTSSLTKLNEKNSNFSENFSQMLEEKDTQKVAGIIVNKINELLELKKI